MVTPQAAETPAQAAAEKPAEAAETAAAKSVKETPAQEDLQQMYSKLFQHKSAPQAAPAAGEDDALQAKFSAVFSKVVSSTPDVEQRRTQAGAGDGLDDPSEERRQAGSGNADDGEDKKFEAEVEMLEGEIDELFPAVAAGDDDGSATEESNA